jgi:hypothetical protein
MKKVIVLGGGISGLSAALFFLNRGCKVELYTENLGGDYTKGGLKYIYKSVSTEKFLNEIGIEYIIKRINGAIYYHNQFWPYPEFMHMYEKPWHELAENGMDIQQRFWQKTRGYKQPIDRRCMNDPWNRGPMELSLKPVGGIQFYVNMLMEIAAKNIHMVIKYDRLNTEGVKRIIEENEFIVYTIPIDIFSDRKFEYKVLNVYRVSCNVKQIWWDYCYFPIDYLFHRVSKQKMGLDFEYNMKSKDQRKAIQVQIKNSCREFLFRVGIDKIEKISFFPIYIKGHLGKEVKDVVVSDNVFRLGRYAQWDSRITYDKVLDKLYRDGERWLNR